MKNILLFLVLFLLILSCKRKDVLTVDKVLKLYKPTVNVNGEIFLQDTSALFNPFDIKIFNDVLVVQELMPVDGHIFTIYDMNTKNYIGKFLKRGKGPNEFIGARLFSWKKDSIMALNVYEHKCQIFSHAKLKNCDNVPDRKIQFQMPNNGEHIDQCIFLDSTILISGQFKYGMFETYTMEGKFLNSFGKYPSVDYNNPIDNYQLGYVFGPSFCFVKNKNKSIAYTNDAGFYILNKDFKEQFKVFWNKPQIGQAAYNEGKPVVSQNAKGLLVGAGDITANEKYIFILYSEYDIFESMKLGIENEFNYILVSDWEGNPIAKFELNEPISRSLEIDDSGEFIYGFRIDIKTGLPQIVRYNITEYLPAK